jgi:uncharacterized membrane protein YjjB (DUF3815 family)
VSPEREQSSDDLVLRTAALLFESGQSTAMTLVAVQRLNRGLAGSGTLVPAWASLTLARPDRSPRTVAVRPIAVHMRRVAALMRVVDEAEDGPLQPDRLRAVLADAARLPGSSTPVFSVACAAAAAALSVVFGTTDPRTIGLIAVAAGLGGVARRTVARWRLGPLAETFVAAVLGGAAGAVAAHVGIGAALVPVCVAMILVPGPHILIGAMDLLSLRISLGLARIGYATMILASVAAGLILGLRLGGETLALSSPAAHVPLLADVLAAGVAAACFPVFFNMPYRMIGWPVAAGMAAHALHWWALSAWHAGLPVAALLSCLLVGVTMAPVAHRHRMPFAGVGFAAVVSLVPGMYVFRTIAGIVELVDDPAPQLLAQTASNGATATLVVICMAVGLIVPTQLRDTLVAARSRPPSPVRHG